MKIIQLNMASGHFFYSRSEIRQGENLASRLNIILSDDFLGYTYNLLFKLNDKTPVLTELLTSDEDNIINYILTNAVTSEAGILQVELQASDTVTGLIAKSSICRLKVIESIDGSGEVMPEEYVPWVTVINAAVAAATEQAGLAEGYATTAGEQAVIASTKAAEAAGYATTAGEKAVEAGQQAGLAEGYATTAGTKATEASGYATTAGEQAGIAEGHATTAGEQAGIASGHATTASQKAGIAAGHATTASTKAGEASASAIAAAGSAGTATAKAQIATDKAAEAVETLAGTVKKTQKVNGTALSGDITVAASAVPVTPAGGISATNVQGALEELDGEKADKLMATNLITNGDFSNGKAGWVTTGTVADGLLTLVDRTKYAYQDVVASIGDKIYFSANATGDFRLVLSDYQVFLGWVATTTTKSVIKSITTNGVRAMLGYYSSGGSQSTYDSTILLNLTAIFGAGNEPSKEQMDEILNQFPNSWFDGTKEILAISQVGKMLMVQPPWIAPTLVNSFENFGGSDSVAGYMRDSMGFVNLAGKIKTGASGASPWTLPSGYRPQYNIVVPIVSNNVFGYCTISTTGVITVYGNATYYSLSGITFKAV